MNVAVLHNLGFSRMGAGRELKKALEQYWAGKTGEAQLRAVGRELRGRHWQLQRQAGFDLFPVGDFAYYDQMLNMTALLGAAPARFGFGNTGLGLDQYFAMARGSDKQPAMEMSKWFDTNYHYIVPEFTRHTDFHVNADWLFEEVDEAQAQGLLAKPVLIGPLTYLYLGKEKQAGFDRLELLPRLLPAYREILAKLGARGVQWVQMDEPVLALDLSSEWVAALSTAYAQLAGSGPKRLLATYFDSVAEHAALLKALPVDGLHVDLVRAPEQLSIFTQDYPEDKVLSAGIIDGRNIWRSDLRQALESLLPAYAALGARLWLAPSCSLLHVPIDLELETELDGEIKSWLAFAVQKLEELATLDKGLRLGAETIAAELAKQERALQDRRSSARIHKPMLRARLEQLSDADFERSSAFAERVAAQRARLKLPAFPTTTIGSFPQTETIRNARAAHKRQELSEEAYRETMREEIRLAVANQEAVGLDVLVHGEVERNDMVEYFGEHLEGVAVTRHGWVQSYGSRCVKPPIIFGDVERPRPMTVEWTRYAQSLTERPMKGMLTGPVTLLQWSFVRDDQPRAATALQIALAIRDEVHDLERAGIAVIQIDEPAFREGLPLKRKDWNEYLEWAVRAFRLCASGVRDETQVHTHMCYSEFNDILPAIAALDADVITIETSRSDMELLEAFRAFRYPNDIGPGVYDIHAPRVPTTAEMKKLLTKAQAVVSPERLWVNPDCGLKTRAWPEVERALKHMVEAGREMRARRNLAAQGT
jgi:5-methyltetrahydropteroyltriglutamate--homocysteine methyltransferase